MLALQIPSIKGNDLIYSILAMTKGWRTDITSTDFRRIVAMDVVDDFIVNDVSFKL